MENALLFERGAPCVMRKVGCVVVKENRVVLSGYNGTPEAMQKCTKGGCPYCTDAKKKKEQPEAPKSSTKKKLKVELQADAEKDGRLIDLLREKEACICVHAEQNLIASAARFGISLAGTTIYVTWAPCFTCFKQLLQLDVNRIVYYRSWSSTVETDGHKEAYTSMIKHQRLFKIGSEESHAANRFMILKDDIEGHARSDQERLAL